ncbi:hypothetical protein E4U61_007247 [Claviceps capensis]|nr:hypothetical protein E4U61_007247 [Claviceps capensis]
MLLEQDTFASAANTSCARSVELTSFHNGISMVPKVLKVPKVLGMNKMMARSAWWDPFSISLPTFLSGKLPNLQTILTTRLLRSLRWLGYLH